MRIERDVGFFIVFEKYFQLVPGYTVYSTCLDTVFEKLRLENVLNGYIKKYYH
jgi:hypothetical protein